MRTGKTLIRLGRCPGWSESSLGTHSFCWFCHVVTHFYFNFHHVAFIFYYRPNKYRQILMYADDLVLMSASTEGLQKCLDDLHIYCKMWKLKVNTDKTKILIFNKSCKLIKKHHFVFESKALEIVKEFKYLGIIIKASGIFTKGISELSN